jgi:hypothetical protein
MVPVMLHLLLLAGCARWLPGPAPVTAAADARCTRQPATDFQSPGSKCPGKPCADLGTKDGSGFGFGTADAQACCQLCADYHTKFGPEDCEYAVFQTAAAPTKNCFLKAAPASPLVGGPGNLGMALLPPDSAWGSSFLLLLVLGGTAYVGGGVLLGRRVSGKYTGLAAHPHFQRWMELKGLVTDGGRLLQGKQGWRPRSKDAVTGYDRIPEQPGMPPRAEDTKVVKKGAAKGKREKGKEKENLGKEKEKGKGSTVEARGKPDSAAVAVVDRAGPKTTPSGGGGKWVHVPA